MSRQGREGGARWSEGGGEGTSSRQPIRVGGGAKTSLLGLTDVGERVRALNLLLPSCVAWSCHCPGRARVGGGGADCTRVQREGTNRRACVDTRGHLLTYCPEDTT